MPVANTQKLLVVPFREVRHFRPDDVLHYESIELRASQYGWTIPAHRHSELHQFQLLTQGSMTVTLDGESHAVTAPAAVMIAPGVVHGFAYDRGSVGCQVSVPSETLATLSAQSPTTANRLSQNILIDLSLPGAKKEECALRFDMLGEEFASQHDGRADALNAHAILLALWFLRHATSCGANVQRRILRDTLVQRFRNLVEHHFLEHRPLRFYASALNVTADHLSRVCRSVTRTSALDIVHERVVLEARRMLMHTGSTVADVAGQLGFSDVGYFSRFFKVATGMSPSDYRNLLASGLTPRPPAHRDSARSAY
jgi:AraC family transcriptional activator of pobA